MSGRFKDWSGLGCRNPEWYVPSSAEAASMTMGRHICQVKNPPDVDALIREIQLSIVQTERRKLNQGEKKGLLFPLEYTD